MKTFINKLKTRKTLEWCLDTFSLLSVLQYCVYRFLQSTMFNFYYPQTYKLVTMGLLLAFGGMRYLYVIMKKWKGKDEKGRRKFLLNCGLAWLLALPFFYVGWLHDYKNLIFLPVCCMCLYDMEAEKVFKPFALTIGTCLLALILCCLSGTVRNLVSQDNFVASYGVINTTDFASYFSFLLLISWCGLRAHKWQTSLLFAFFTLIITYGIYRVTESRTSLYTGGLTILLVLWDCLPQEQRWIRPIRNTVKWISILAFPIIGTLVVFFTVQYAAGEAWAQQLNATLSGRLSTVLLPYRSYGITPFGNKIELLHGQGGTILGEFWSSGYGYLDVSYAMLAIKYGWVITAIVAGLWIWMTVKAFRTGNDKTGYALAIMAAHAFSEARILDINYNILLVIPFCQFGTKIEATEKNTKDKLLHSLISGVAILGISYLLLPRTLSWLRTFFYLKSWNNGTAAFNAFVLCACGVIALWLLWKTGISLREKRGKGPFLALAGLLLALVGGVIAVNNTIEHGRAEQMNRLAEEEQIIRSIQETAIMPVYASESEELYRRNGIALENHLFSTDELGRKKGTIFVNNNTEALATVVSGGLYVQISEHTGLYTYDSSVAEMLKRSGFEVTRGYSGIHCINMRDMALFNDVNMKDYLNINSRRITTSNDETDQLYGEYQVVFSLSDLSLNTEGEAVLLEVLGEHGEQSLFQKALTTNDFDAEGYCTCILSYQINPMPGVSYAVTAMEGVSVNVDRISWQRVFPKEKEFIHGANILKKTENPQIGESDYENGIWRYASGGSGVREIVAIEDPPIEGIIAGFHITGSVNDSSYTDVAVDRIPVVYGETYRLSCYAKGRGQLKMQHGIGPWPNVSFDLSDEWKKYSIDFIAGENDGSRYFPFTNVYFGVPNDVESDVLICGMSMLME